MSATAPSPPVTTEVSPKRSPVRLATPRDFDPSPYVRQLKSRGGQIDYLDVKHRLLWLRTEHPDAQIVTELLRLDDQSAVFKATVTIPGGGLATGHGSETARDFTDYIEKAETKSLGRALNALGFGAQFAENDAEEPRPAPAPNQGNRQSTRSAAPPASRAKNEEWTIFWQWAKASGFADQSGVESAIGRSIEGLSAAELQTLLAPQVQGLSASA